MVHSRLRQASEQFWLALGKAPEEILDTDEMDSLRACLAAAVGEELLPRQTSQERTSLWLHDWLDALAGSLAPAADDDAEARVVFLNRLFRHVTTTKGGFGSINKMIEQTHIPDTVVLQGRKHKLLPPSKIAPLTPVATATPQPEVSSSPTVAPARASPWRMHVAAVDEVLELRRAESLRERETTLQARRDEAVQRAAKALARDRKREANIIAKREAFRQLALALEEEDERDEGTVQQDR